MIFFLVALLALLVGLFLLNQGRKRRLDMGLPIGEVIYQDHGAQPMKTQTLVSERYGIVGKPDCLIRTSEGIIPIEYKQSARPPARGDVYPNHRIQVLAYCVLVGENYSEPVPYGLVLYAGEEARRVYPTAENLAWLVDVVCKVRAGRDADDLARSHSNRGRCFGCGLRQVCDQSLVTSDWEPWQAK